MSNPEMTTLLVSSGSGPGECQQAVGHLLREMKQASELHGVDMDISERGGRDGPTSAIVSLSGQGVKDFASGWVGVVLWRCQSALRPRHRRKNWFVQVYELDKVTSSVDINPGDVEMQAIRAGGPGGQHQNKTSSAIRAKWTHPCGRSYNVVVRADRSQHRNRKIAIDRLQALVSYDLLVEETSRLGNMRVLHYQLERGNPCKIFEGPMFRAV